RAARLLEAVGRHVHGDVADVGERLADRVRILQRTAADVRRDVGLAQDAGDDLRFEGGPRLQQHGDVRVLGHGRILGRPHRAVIMLILAALALVQGPEPFALPELPPRAQTVRGAVEGDPAAVRRDRGVWPIANGRVFAYVGYGEPANRMFMVTGPQYQTRRNHEPDGTFGQLWIELVEGDSPLMAVERTWQEASRAAAVRTREGFASGAGLETTDFAHAERPVLLRRVRVELPDAAGARLVVHFDDRPDGPARADGTALRKTYRKDDATFRLHASVLHATEGTAVTAQDGTLTIVLPEGVPRPELTLALVTSRFPDEEQETLRAVAAADPDALLDDALRAWR